MPTPPAIRPVGLQTVLTRPRPGPAHGPAHRRPHRVAFAVLLLAAVSGLGAGPPPAEPAPPGPGSAQTGTFSPRVTPISGPLGLADIAVLDPGGHIRSGWIVLSRRDLPGTTFRIPLEPSPATPLVPPPTHPADTNLRWTCRVMAGPGPTPAPDAGPKVWDSTITFATELDTDAGPVLIPVQVAIAEPPERLRTPDWAKGAVWYQVFPERFRNGNPDNDPRGPDTYLKAWASDWEAVPPAELESARAAAAADGRPLDPERRGGQLYTVMGRRRYGGDLQGVVEALDSLADLGVTAIYLNPIFRSTSAHGYDAADHRHIDDHYGTPPGVPLPADPLVPPEGETDDPATWTWTPADRYLIDVLLPEAHRRGMHVILDGVWNHVGTSHFAFRDLQRRGRASPYAAWFDARFAPSDDPAGLAALRARHPGLSFQPGGLIGWKSWGGRNGGLPEFSRTPESAGGPRAGRLHPAVEAHIFAVTRRWMDPTGDGDASKGIDGWRLDVVPDVPLPFWEAWRRHVKSINPGAPLFAEVWSKASGYFGGRAFDGQMNYPFAMPVVDWLGLRPGLSGDWLARQLQSAADETPQINLVQMNLFASHDTDRFVSMLSNPGRGYDQACSIPNGAAGYRTERPPPAVYARSLLGVALQATYEGSPMIYYGDEWGMHGADDPDDRKPLPWPDAGPNERPDDLGMPEVRARYRAWLRLRADSEIGPVLRYGSTRQLTAAGPDVFAFGRVLNGRWVLVVLNRGGEPFDAAALGGVFGEVERSGGEGDGAVTGWTVPAGAARWWLGGTGAGRSRP